MREHFDFDRLSIVEAESGEEAIRMVAVGEADVTLSDANLLLARLSRYPELDFFPASEEIDNLSWAVAVDNTLLESIVAKSIDYLKRSRTFDLIWTDYYGISVNEYLALLTL